MRLAHPIPLPPPPFFLFVQAHNRVEKIAIRRKNRRKKLLPWVVTAGLLYGEEEDLFHYLFKAAWHGAPKKLPCVRGDNTLPTLHVRDLASIIRQVTDAPGEVVFAWSGQRLFHTDLEAKGV